MEQYKSVLKEGSFEIEIKKSKFIGFAKPVETEIEAQEFIAYIKKNNRNANHNVPAYLIGLNNEIQKCSDDGEPSGSAGVPMLDLLRKEDLKNVVVVVTRYFGGIKLGVGGLVRAYTQTAKGALKESIIIECKKMCKIKVILEYSQYDKIENLINKEELIVLDTEYSQDIELIILINKEEVDEMKNRMINICNGNIYTEVCGEDFYKISDRKVILD